MNWHAVPVAILAGITGYSAIIFAGLYFALAKALTESSCREYLTFAIACVFGVAYNVATIGMYQSISVAQGIVWQRFQLMTLGFLGASYTAFVWDLQKKRMPVIIRVAGVFLLVLGLIVGFWKSPYTLTVTQPSFKAVHVLGHEIDYYEGDLGVITQGFTLLFLVALVVHMWYTLRYFQTRSVREQRGKHAFVFVTFFVVVAGVNDACVSSGLYTFLYLAEYGIAAIWMAITYILLMRLGELQEAVNALNGDLSRTHSELVFALKQARQSVRAKTEFLASISHELRTPLNAIINLPEGLLTQFVTARVFACRSCGAAFMLEEGEVVGENPACETCGAAGLVEEQGLLFLGEAVRTQACLKTVARAGRHLLGLVNNMLDATNLGRETVSRVSFDPRALVSEVVDSAQTLADKNGVRLRLQAPSGSDSVAPIVADRIQIAQVLYNLISNAIQFSPQRGRIDVSVWSPSNSEVAFCVRDRGIGIAPEDSELIFKKFGQVDGAAPRAAAGTGLGLAISKELVELHGGKIWFESTKGNGASFFVRLPSVPPPSLDGVDSGSTTASTV